jgi:cytochrome P450
MLSPFIWPDWLPFRKQREKRWAIRTLDGVIRRFIATRRSTGEDRGDLLSMLLLAVDEEGDHKGLTDEQVRDQCMTLFLAGHDTTAAGLMWVGWVLARHPEIAERTRAEVDAALARREPTYADLPALAYTERVVKEALRYYPPAIAIFGRKALEDITIGSWTIPKGGIVRAVSYVTHHDPRWFPEPDRIDPDRFAPGRVEQLPQLAYFPFGAGPRVCVGQHFAMMEMTLLTAMLVQRFTFAAAPGQGEPVLSAQMSLRPKDGLRLTLTSR